MVSLAVISRVRHEALRVTESDKILSFEWQHWF